MEDVLFELQPKDDGSVARSLTAISEKLVAVTKDAEKTAAALQRVVSPFITLPSPALPETKPTAAEPEPEQQSLLPKAAPPAVAPPAIPITPKVEVVTPKVEPPTVPTPKAEVVIPKAPETKTDEQLTVSSLEKLLDKQLDKLVPEKSPVVRDTKLQTTTTVDTDAPTLSGIDQLLEKHLKKLPAPEVTVEKPDPVVVQQKAEPSRLERLLVTFLGGNLGSKTSTFITEKITKVKETFKEVRESRPVQTIVPAATRVASAAVSAGTTIASGAVNVLGGAVAVFNKLIDSVQRFVAAANPAAVMRLDLAFEDLNATIGTFLVPIINVASRLVEKFANTLATFQGGGFIAGIASVLEKAGEVFIALVSPIMDVVEAVMNFLMPVFEVLLGVINELKPAIMLIADSIRMVLGSALEKLKPILSAVVVVIGVVIQAFAKMIEFIYKVNYVIFELLRDPTRITELGNVWDDATRRVEAATNRLREGTRTTATRGISVMSLDQVSNRALEAAGRLGTERDFAAETAENTRRMAEALQREAQERAANGNEGRGRSAIRTAWNIAQQGTLPFVYDQFRAAINRLRGAES